jgi:hypothetical protein
MTTTSKFTSTYDMKGHREKVALLKEDPIIIQMAAEITGLPVDTFERDFILTTRVSRNVFMMSTLAEYWHRGGKVDTRKHFAAPMDAIKALVEENGRVSGMAEPAARAMEPPFDGGEECPFCPVEVRNLHAVAHNYVLQQTGRSDSRDTTFEDLERAVEACESLRAAHFSDSMHSHGHVPARPAGEALENCTCKDAGADMVEVNPTCLVHGVHVSIIVNGVEHSVVLGEHIGYARAVELAGFGNVEHHGTAKALTVVYSVLAAPGSDVERSGTLTLYSGKIVAACEGLILSVADTSNA